MEIFGEMVNPVTNLKDGDVFYYEENNSKGFTVAMKIPETTVVLCGGNYDFNAIDLRTGEHIQVGKYSQITLCPKAKLYLGGDIPTKDKEGNTNEHSQ